MAAVAESNRTETQLMKLKMRANSDPAARAPRAPAIIVVLSVVGILLVSLWYLVQPQPLLVQGEADASRIDVAARGDGRVATRPVHRGENVQSGQNLARDPLVKTGMLAAVGAPRLTAQVSGSAGVWVIRRAMFANQPSTTRLLVHEME
jgi:multidrug efflux pump subunit AcrA (membrane-fusion protein)